MSVKQLRLTTLKVGNDTDVNGLGGLDFGNAFQVENLPVPTLNNQAANKLYVDNAIAAITAFTNVSVIMTADSAQVSQNPVALDTPIKIEFGPPQTTTDVDLDFDAPPGTEASIFTFNTTGVYIIRTMLNIGRTAGGGIAEVGAQLFINGIATTNGFFVNRLATSDEFKTYPFPVLIMEITAATTFYFEVGRLSQNGGVNDGGLFDYDATLSIPTWTMRPSASISISKFV